MQTHKDKTLVKQMKKIELIVKEDQKTIESYSAMKPREMNYRYSRGKSLVRNFRDLEIYRAMKTDEVFAFGKFQWTADYIQLHRNRLDRMEMPGAGAQEALRVDQVILHLCESSLLKDSVEDEDLKRLTDRLMAGMYKEDEGLAPELCRQLQDEGIQALGEIYLRQLEGLRRKYPDNKLMKLSPADYLKAYPGIEQDFACIGDMRRFFTAYGEALPQNEEMSHLLAYYQASWEALQRRQDAFIRGDLDGRADASFREEMKRIYGDAKAQKLFAKKPARKYTPLTGYFKTGEVQKQGAEDTGLYGMKEWYEAAVKEEDSLSLSLSLSLKEALEMPLEENRFENPAKLDFGVIKTEIAACRKVLEFREKQPNYYHLGLSYTQRLKAEGMCELLRYYEKALELTLRYYGLKKRGDTHLSQLEREQAQAVQEYDRKRFRVYHNSVGKEYREDRVDRYEEAKKQLLEKEDIWPEGTDEEVKNITAEAMDFITDHEAGMTQREVASVIRAAEYLKVITGEEPEYTLSDSRFDSLSRMVVQFMLAGEELENKLREADYADYKLFELREEIFACERQAHFLNRFFEKKEVRQKLKEQCEKSPNRKLPKEMYDAVPSRIETLRGIADYTGGIEIEYAMQNGIQNMKVMKEEKGVLKTEILESRDLMKEKAGEKRKAGTGVVDKLRVAKATEENKDVIAKMQMDARVRRALGREILASDRKVFLAAFKTGDDLATVSGGLMGTFLQLFNWIKHEPRTADHGIAVYEQCSAKYEEMMRTLGADHSMHHGALPLWQRGSQDYTPPVELDQLFSSPLKKRILGRLREEASQGILLAHTEDIKDTEFCLAMEAISKYSTIVGIVNTDTTEMEMAFLDMFLKQADDYVKYSHSNEEALVVSRCSLLKEIRRDLEANLQGTMAGTMSEEELRRIDEGTLAYVEDTRYFGNYDNSNIKDIPLFLHEPNVNDVRQSSIGDCWLVSAVSALVKSNPEFIKSMFHDTGDGNVIVRLYATEKNGEECTPDPNLISDKEVRFHPVYFKLRKHYETGWGNAADCTWVQLLEKAYALSGFNGRKEMKVKGNRLYNVTDELTFGHQGVGLMHLTGQHPREIEKKTGIALAESFFYNGKYIAAVYAGLPRELAVSACEKVFEPPKIGEAVFPSTTQGLKEHMKACMSEEEREKYGKEYEGIIDDNIRKLKDMILPEGYRELTGAVLEKREQYSECLPATVPLEDPELEKRALASWAQYFDHERNRRYTPEENLFYHRCKESFAKGEALAISIPHCVDLLAAEEKDGRYFLLMRDPFNIYNNEYTKVGRNEVTATQDRLNEVFSGHKANRRLMGSGEDYIKSGFRGTSWIELKDIYEMIVDAYSAPADLRVDFK